MLRPPQCQRRRRPPRRALAPGHGDGPGPFRLTHCKPSLGAPGPAESLLRGLGARGRRTSGENAAPTGSSPAGPVLRLASAGPGPFRVRGGLKSVRHSEHAHLPSNIEKPPLPIWAACSLSGSEPQINPPVRQLVGCLLLLPMQRPRRSSQVEGEGAPGLPWPDPPWARMRPNGTGGRRKIGAAAEGAVFLFWRTGPSSGGVGLGPREGSGFRGADQTYVLPSLGLQCGNLSWKQNTLRRRAHGDQRGHGLR